MAARVQFPELTRTAPASAGSAAGRHALRPPKLAPRTFLEGPEHLQQVLGPIRPGYSVEREQILSFTCVAVPAGWLAPKKTVPVHSPY